MNQEFILGKLADLMNWDSERSRQEFAWLRLMSRMKYDGYQDFLAGKRFVESLAAWLQQFKAGDRETAYRFVREKLVFISPSEMNHLVELFYPDTVRPRLVRKVADSLGIPQYRVWADPAATNAFKTLLRKTLFIELSDGARIDVFRHENAGIISHEQIVTAPRIHKNKWQELLQELQSATGNANERFAFIYLVDDFTGSGTSLIRQKDGVWKGKLSRFWDDVSSDVIEMLCEPDWTLCVHHYLATHRAVEIAKERDAARRSATGNGKWFDNVEFSTSYLLPVDFPIDPKSETELVSLVERYYDDAIENKHIKEGGKGAQLGFGQSALPLILEHNTPNNALAFLWAETLGQNGKHAMRPLFRRRERHT